MTDEEFQALADRVTAFHLMELPGQPRAMHMGTSYLIGDLWRAVREIHGIAAAPAGRDAEALPAERIAEVVKEDGGWWYPCSGCHETNEGYSTGHYPRSKAFGCEVGSGCTECGGLGVVWHYPLDEAAIRELAAAPAPGRFALGQRVRKVKGSSWQGRVVGYYSTSLTPVGYAVESEREPGSVQIYPEAALEARDAS